MNKHVIGQLSDVDLRLLRIFRVIVEAGGFSAAEVVLNISSAAISVAVSDLETRLGFRLCQRGRSGFSLTEEGREIYEYILQLFSSIEDFKTQINGLHTQLKGELNIGITDTLVSMPKMTITNSLALLKDQGPDVVINIWMMPPNDVELGILKGRLHVGIMPTTKQISGLEYHDLYSERSQLYCEASHPLFVAKIMLRLISGLPCCLPMYRVPRSKPTSNVSAPKRQRPPLTGKGSPFDFNRTLYWLSAGPFCPALGKRRPPARN
ncbi:LysR family transcriptional regulator [Aliamphritea spongicola]